MKKSKEKKIKNTGLPRKKRARRRGQNRLLLGLVLALVLATAYMNFSLKSSLASLDRVIISQEEEIQDLEKTSKSLASDVDAKRNSEDLLKLAKYQLGMVYPEDDQVVYIDVQAPEAQDQEEAEGDFLNPVISVLKFFK